MAEYIECRNCDSPYCDGCNIYSLATMLNNGKFDCLMNNNHSINCSANVVEVVHGEWLTVEYNDGSVFKECSNCGARKQQRYYNFCSNCGADMRRIEKRSTNV